MPFRIEEIDDRLIVRDTPSGHWTFGSVFVLSGIMVLSLTVFSDVWQEYVLWERLAALALGIGHLGIGSWYVFKHFETITTFDRRTDSALSVRRRPFSSRRETAEFKVSDARSIEIRRSVDSDGDPLYQLRLWLSGSRVLPLQGQPARNQATTEEAAATLRHALSLPDSAAPHA